MTKERIKVVQVIADSKIGGGTNHVLGLLKSLDQKKFQPFLICPKGYLADKAREIAGLEVATVPFNGKFDLVSFFRLRRSLELIQSLGFPFTPMVVHSHGPRAGFYTLCASPRSAIRVYTEHLYTSEYRLKSAWNDWIQRRMLRQVYRTNDETIAVSTSVVEYLSRNKLVAKSRLIQIPNAIDVEECESVRARECESKKIKEVNHAPVIGTVGSLNAQKGQEWLIKAFPAILQKYPLATLEIIGEGSQRGKLEALIQSLGLNRHVSLLGKKNDPVDYMEHWDVFVLPSISETFGIVLLEAMAVGIPIVATKVGGVTDILSHKKNALLIHAKNSEELATSVLSLLEHPAMAGKLKHSAKDRLKDFEWQRIIKQIESVYEQLTDREDR